MGQRLSGQAVVGSCLLHNGRKITIETGTSSSTEHEAKHVNQQHKTQSKTRKSNSTKQKWNT
jgi:hypothetical protein